MDTTQAKQITDFLIKVREDLCEGDGDTAARRRWTELLRVIKRSMHAALDIQYRGLKILRRRWRSARGSTNGRRGSGGG